MPTAVIRAVSATSAYERIHADHAPNRPTSSVAKCSACVALPPLPNQKTVPPTSTRSMTASAAARSEADLGEARHHRLVFANNLFEVHT